MILGEHNAVLIDFIFRHLIFNFHFFAGAVVLGSCAGESIGGT
jgi:hypothetical protein